MIETNRRSLIAGLVSLVAAPAIVRVSSIMPVKALVLEEPQILIRYSGYELFADDVALAEPVHRYIYYRAVRDVWKIVHIREGAS